MDVNLKWYELNQNNSGGYFYRNECVQEVVLIQAEDPDDAEARADAIISGYTDYCECCGERWSIWFDESDGKDTPSIYNTPIEEVEDGWYRHGAVLHYVDGTIRYYRFGVGFVPFEEMAQED